MKDLELEKNKKWISTWACKGNRQMPKIYIYFFGCQFQISLYLWCLGRTTQQHAVKWDIFMPIIDLFAPKTFKLFLLKISSHLMSNECVGSLLLLLSAGLTSDQCKGQLSLSIFSTYGHVESFTLILSRFFNILLTCIYWNKII